MEAGQFYGCRSTIRAGFLCIHGLVSLVGLDTYIPDV